MNIMSFFGRRGDTASVAKNRLQKFYNPKL